MRVLDRITTNLPYTHLYIHKYTLTTTYTHYYTYKKIAKLYESRKGCTNWVQIENKLRARSVEKKKKETEKEVVAVLVGLQY